MCLTCEMRIERVVPDPTVYDLDKAAAERSAVLGMTVLMNHEWIVTPRDAEGHQLRLMTRDATASVNPDRSVFVSDVRETFAKAVGVGLEIVHPLTEEPWGVTRFCYRDSAGRVVNVGAHAP